MSDKQSVSQEFSETFIKWLRNIVIKYFEPNTPRWKKVFMFCIVFPTIILGSIIHLFSKPENPQIEIEFDKVN